MSIYIRWPTPGGSGSGVTSLNTLTGALTLAAGTNITITPSGGNTLTIDATGGITGISIGDPIGGSSPGSVLFIDGGSNLAQDNALFFWNDPTAALILGSNSDDTTGSALQIHGQTVMVAPTTGASLNFQLNNSGPYFIGDGSTKSFTVYTYYHGIFDAVGSNTMGAIPNDGQGYNANVSWTSPLLADGFIVYDTVLNQWIDVGNQNNVTFDGSSSFNSGPPTLSPTSFVTPSARFYSDVNFQTNVEVVGTVQFDSSLMVGTSLSCNSLAVTNGSTFLGVFNGVGGGTTTTFNTTGQYDAFAPAIFHQGFLISDANSMSFGTTTGTRIGTATNQKIGFFNATPVVQQSGNVGTALSNLGLVTSPTFPGGSITGQVPVANGGTALASGTSGGILGFTATGTIASSALLTNHAIILGGGAGATPTALGSLGTTTTVLHGNAAGAPTFGAVALGSDVSGTLLAAQFPALTGDVTTTAGSLATTIGANKVTNSQLAQAATLTLKGNNTGGTANVSDLTVSQVNTMLGTLSNPMTTGGDIIYGGASGTPTRLANGSSGQYLKSTGGTTAPAWQSFTAPTVQKFTSSSGTYTTPTSPGPLYIRVLMVGGGGGGGGTATSSPGAGTGGTGGNTTFGTTLLVANGGVGGPDGNQGGIGGTGSLGSGPIGTAQQGSQGGPAMLALGTNFVARGGDGGTSPFGGAGGGNYTGAGNAAQANSGSGGGGGGGQSTLAYFSGSGGGAGGYVDAIITSPSATYAYAVGAAGAAGTAGTNGVAGGAGGSGYIIVYEYFQ